jgi:hypothetical protein
MNQKKFERVWSKCESVKEVCRKLKITEQSAYYWARKFGLPTFCGMGDESSPSPEEIAERAAEIRATWSPEEEQRRFVGGSRRRSVEIHSYYSQRSSGARSLVYV